VDEVLPEPTGAPTPTRRDRSTSSAGRSRRTGPAGEDASAGAARSKVRQVPEARIWETAVPAVIERDRAWCREAIGRPQDWKCRAPQQDLGSCPPRRGHGGTRFVDVREADAYLSRSPQTLTTFSDERNGGGGPEAPRVSPEEARISSSATTTATASGRSRSCSRFSGASGWTPSFHPHRLRDGYGLKLPALLRVLEEHRPDGIVTVDCGITAVDGDPRGGGPGVSLSSRPSPPAGPLPSSVLVNPKVPGARIRSRTSRSGLAWKLATALLEAAGDRSLAAWQSSLPRWRRSPRSRRGRSAGRTGSSWLGLEGLADPRALAWRLS